MKRRILNAISGLSLLVFAAMLVLWVRSYWHWDRIGCEGATTSAGNYSGGYISNKLGGLELTVWIRPDPQAGGRLATDITWASGELTDRPSVRTAHLGFMKSLGAKGFLGFWYVHTNVSFSPGGATPQSTWILAVPYWSLALLAGLLPALWLYRRWHRLPRSHCAVCGYDLRASRHRCPECGTPIAVTSADRAKFLKEANGPSA